MSIYFFSRCNHCEKPCMSPITFAIHADQHLLKKHHQCSTCNQKYSSFLKFYTEDFCGDNAIPKNVKMYVNNTVFKLRFLEEDTEIIGENFANHFSKYAKRATIQELPRDVKKLKKGRFRRNKAAYSKNDLNLSLNLPETIEEWIINIPSMLDARVALSVVDRDKADTQLEEEFVWEYDDGETERIVFEEKSPNKSSLSPKSNFCTICKKRFATVSDLDQHSVIHKIKTEPEPSPETSSVTVSTEPQDSGSSPKLIPPRLRKLPSSVTTIICPDCDGCSEACDHSDHGIMLRRDSIAEHVARTGHRRCRAAGEIRPETECKVRQIMSTVH